MDDGKDSPKKIKWLLVVLDFSHHKWWLFTPFSDSAGPGVQLASEE
jgi:hypothetical protein